MRSDLEAVRARIVEIERLIVELRAEQSAAQERLNSYKYPVANLPGEIISEIFVHFLPISPPCPPLRGIFSPTTLTHICSKWRAIALATPALWTAMEFDDYSRSFPICDTWLSRTGSCSLSIRVPDHTWRSPVKLRQIVTAIVPHRERLEHLKIHGLSERTFPLVDGPLPRLRHLELSLFSSPLDKFTLQGAPKLRKAVLNLIAALRVTLPWGQLTSLTLSSIDLSEETEWASILQHTTRLVDCDLSFWVPSYTPPHIGPNIVLPSLEVLLLRRDAGSGAMAGLLAMFVLPALLRLEIPETFLVSYSVPNPLDSLSSLISRSGCTIQEIQITERPPNRTFSPSVPEVEYRATFPSIPKFSFEYDAPDSDSDY